MFDAMEKNSIDIKEVSGDIIGVGIDGSGNIIGKNISVVINQVQDYGLNLLSPDYFKDYKSTEQDLEDWKKGFSFKLEAIKEKKEFRRSIVDKIKSKLENDHRLLVVGESGTSKSTILMEIMCEYFDYGYKILYGFGESEIKNVRELVKFIEDLLKGGNKILVAVDNTHTERTSAIFYVMDQLSNYELSGNLRFILTARLPEFDWFVNDRLNKVEEAYRHSIRKFAQMSEFRYELEFFTKNEIEQFVKKYRENKISADNKVSGLAATIFDITKGHPIMVKFYVFKKGLEEDVKDRYYRYLINQITMEPDSTKIQTTLICSLLDIANLPVTDQLLESMQVLTHAYDLEHAILYQYSEGLWRTIHPRWDTELLSFLFSERNKSILSKRKEYLKKAADSIFSIYNESLSASIIQTIYDIASTRIVPINIVESSVHMPDYLNNNTKCNLYVLAMAGAYRRLQMNNEISDKCNKAIELDPNNADAWNMKGWAQSNLGKYEEAIRCFDKAIELDPNNADAWYNKGATLYTTKRYDKAIECCNKAIEINNNSDAARANKVIYETKRYDDVIGDRILANTFVKKGISLGILKQCEEAIRCFDKAIELDPDNGPAWTNKSWALNLLSRYDEAIECCNKAIEINNNQKMAWFNKGVSLDKLERFYEAIECYDKTIELDPNDANAWMNKGTSLDKLERFYEAIECYDKTIELDPDNADHWMNKGATLDKLERFYEAIECCNKAIEINPNNANAWNSKAWILANTNRHNEALPLVERSLEINPNNANALDTKGFILYNSGQYKEALEYYDKALNIYPEYSECLSHKGLSFVKLDKIDNAKECYNEAIKIDSNNAYAWYYRAKLYIAYSDTENGLIDLNKAIEIGKQRVIEKAKKDKDFESIRDDERFKAILDKHDTNG
jgi:tetratricopeptide (TPR) repeat protein